MLGKVEIMPAYPIHVLERNGAEEARRVYTNHGHGHVIMVQVRATGIKDLIAGQGNQRPASVRATGIKYLVVEPSSCNENYYYLRF
jgi:hypothetical protein